MPDVSEAVGRVRQPDPSCPRQRDLLVGATLGGRFRILRFLDRGATASVYLAHDHGLDERVVVKRLEPAAAANAALRERFLFGASVVQNLLHPNVVRVLDVVEPKNDLPFVVMERLIGESLGSRLTKFGRPRTDTAVRLLAGAAHGLAALHEQGLVHRDVKPDNLFMVPGPRGAHSAEIKVVDFGLARRAGGENSEAALTAAGTAQYMAPEQVVGDPVDARSDVYALGMVLYRLCTGRLPFDLDLSVELLRHHLYSPVPGPRSLNPEIDARLEGAILKAVRKRPEHRYPSMKALLRDLEGILGLHADPVVVSGLSRDFDNYRPRTENGERAVGVLAPRPRRCSSTGLSTAQHPV